MKTDTNLTSSPTTTEELADQIYARDCRAVQIRTDQLFFWLLVGQWAFAIIVALLYSPYGWAGKERTLHLHVRVAVLFGAAINALPLVLIVTRPAWWGTRQVIAVAQMLWSALLIHLTGGRIETHFHVFGSLAFLAFYRDWKVLPTATLVVTIDHLARGLFWPESVYGIVNPEWWRFLEHAFWVVFEDAVLVLGCWRSQDEMRLMARREAVLEETNARVEQQVRERTAELGDSLERYRALVESTNAVPWEFDLRSRRLEYVAPQAPAVLQCSKEALRAEGFFAGVIHPDDRLRVERSIADYASASHVEAGSEQLDYRILTSDDRILEVRSILSRRQNAANRLRGITLDLTHQKKLELELRQAQKLESVGRLAAGVAHEINTPMQFVSDSVYFVRDAVGDVMRLVDTYRSALGFGTAPKGAGLTQADVRAVEDASDLPYLDEHLPKAIDRALDGLNRMTTIVRSMMEFAHPGHKEMTPVDLNHSIESTLTIARNEYKYVADVETHLGDVPPVTCHGGDINQAILNIIVNAAHAIREVVSDTSSKGRITIRSWQDGDRVSISVSDTGAGIPEAIRHRIFDPFFTTKEVGQGTGQGLAIAHAIVVDRHGGELTFETEPRHGTTFLIQLPIAARGTRRQEAAA